MPYLGNTPTSQSFISGTDYFNGTGSQTAFTLTRTVNSVNDIEAVVNNVVQQPNSAYTLSGTTITFTSAPSSGTSNIYVRYLSTTMQSFTVPANSITRNQLDSNLQSVAVGRNRIINGAMVIDQRNAGASVTPTANFTYTLDRWVAGLIQASKFSVQQNAGSVTPPAGFTNYLGVTSLSAYSVLSTDYFNINQFIEGFNWADLGFGTANAKTVTLSFWVRSSLTGTFGGVLGNSAGDRTYPFTYTISVANTWEQKSITIAGDTSGTWVGATNGIGARLWINLGAGSTFSGTAGAWASANYTSATGAVSVVGTNGASFYITGVQLEVGSSATSFEYRQYGTELALCQRYFQRNFGQNSATLYLGRIYAPSAGSGAPLLILFKVSMRTAPTATIVGTWITFNITGQPAFSGITTEAAYIFGAATAAGDAGFYTDSASVGVTFSAEL
jgi:hypothetical protein